MKIIKVQLQNRNFFSILITLTEICSKKVTEGVSSTVATIDSTKRNIDSKQEIKREPLNLNGKQIEILDSPMNDFKYFLKYKYEFLNQANRNSSFDDVILVFTIFIHYFIS
jgi:hypothetical protein